MIDLEDYESNRENQSIDGHRGLSILAEREVSIRTRDRDVEIGVKLSEIQRWIIEEKKSSTVIVWDQEIYQVQLTNMNRIVTIRLTNRMMNFLT